MKKEDERTMKHEIQPAGRKTISEDGHETLEQVHESESVLHGHGSHEDEEKTS